MGIETALIVGATAVGAGASMASGRSQARAIQRAGEQQAEAQNQALQLQREQYEMARQQLTPYVREGDAARRMALGALGLQSYPTVVGQPGAPQQPGMPGQFAPGFNQGFGPQNFAMQGYMPFEPVPFGFDQVDPNNIATQSYGGQLQQIQQDTGQDLVADPIAEARADFYRGYETTPYAAAAQAAQRRANNALMGAFGAGGISGKAQRAGQEALRMANLGGQQDYLNMLMGVADQGYGASTGIASGGANFASNAAAALTRAAAARGEAGIGAAQARGQALENAAGFVGYGMGQIGNLRKPPAPTPFSIKPQAGSWYNPNVGVFRGF